jgi:cytochrome c oxidase cbb3-type subunit 2
VQPLTPTEAAGRDVFVANGCSYCHTQQVRPLAQDMAFGRPSTAGDFAYETPELLGSERTGPDLTAVGERRGSDVWQYMHLYNPRSVVPQSIMPSYAWMFRVAATAPAGVAAVPVPAAFAPANGVVIPGHDAQVLVAYLLSRKQPSLAPTKVSATAAPAATPASPAAPPAVAPAPVKLAASAPPAAAPAADIAHGKELYGNNCAACHQATGAGLPGAFPPLKGNAVANDPDPTEHIRVVLFGAHDKVIDGVKYASPMPPWGSQFSDQEVADIIDYERSAWGNHGKPITAADVAAVRAKGE